MIVVAVVVLVVLVVLVVVVGERRAKKLTVNNTINTNTTNCRKLNRCVLYGGQIATPDLLNQLMGIGNFWT